MHRESTAIGTLRVRWTGRDTPLLRLGLADLLDGSDLSAGWDAPGAILLVRRLTSQQPIRLTRPPFTTGLDTRWAGAVRQRLGQLHPDAVSPNNGQIPDHAGAVLFVDESEMLAGLALAVRQGAAGDGIYRCVFQADRSGHYNFLFATEGKSKDAGHFSRQQLKTVHVRYVPHKYETEIDIKIDPFSSGNTLLIKFKPKIVLGNFIEPGYGNYFWFTVLDTQPFKAVDNMDGPDTANFAYGAGDPPSVAMHFLRVSTAIEDEVTSDKLPVTFGGDSVLVSDVREIACGCFGIRCHLKRSGKK